MNADSKQPIILLREVEPGEWWMEMPRITCEVDERLDAGIDFMHAGDFNQAVAVFARLINELPEHLDAYHHLALTLQYAGRNHEATDVWRCAVELAMQFFPERFDFTRHQLPWLELGNRPFLRAYHGLGLCLLDNGEVEAALEIFERLVSLNPNDNLGARALVVGCRLAKVVWIRWRLEVELVAFGKDMRAVGHPEHGLEADALFTNLAERLVLRASPYRPQYGLEWADVTKAIEESGLGRDIRKRELHRLIHRDLLTVDPPPKRKV